MTDNDSSNDINAAEPVAADGGAMSRQPNSRSKAFFETAIAAEWRKNTAGIIRVAHLVVEAHEELDRDVFAALKLPFGPRASQMLRRVAAHPIIANRRTMVRCRRAGARSTSSPSSTARC